MSFTVEYGQENDRHAQTFAKRRDAREWAASHQPATIHDNRPKVEDAPEDDAEQHVTDTPAEDVVITDNPDDNGFPLAG